jgi:hypothetical protein
MLPIFELDICDSLTPISIGDECRQRPVAVRPHYEIDMLLGIQEALA